MDLLAGLGRVVFGLYFAYSGLNHFRQAAGMAAYAGAMGVPAPKASVVFSGLMLLAGGLSFVLGYYVQTGAVLLAVFLVAAALVMHPFWKMQDPAEASGQFHHFGKNLALAGAALLAGYLGAGPLSLGG